tara:strand:+ start:606 stop:1559 length:954 start_codon:yes stop_codon:yes gene_type:complete
MLQKHEEIIKSKTGNYIVTIAIGKKVFREWSLYSKKTWIIYCKKNSLGLIVITKNLIDKNNIFWKKPTWQKFLLGSYLREALNSKISNVCYLDTDILINPLAPNVFDFHDSKKISVVSMINKLPYDLNLIRKKISFYRNKYYSRKYPLDSSIFMTLDQMYKFHNFKTQKDSVCAGFFIFNVKIFSEIMKKWFFKYKKNIKNLTGGGDQPVFNYEVFQLKKTKILDYKFQALWIYEMAIKYPYLYCYKNKKNLTIKKSIEATLADNYFLHFAGSWYEGQMWKMKDIATKEFLIENKQFLKYLKKKSTGKAKGRILPKL